MPKDISTQNFIPIQDLRDGVAILKNGQMNVVLLASSINFALKSHDEQSAILSQFQTFLNTLDFSLQIYVQSRRLNINPYLALLADREKDQYNDLMKIQLREYMNFVETFVKEVDIMSKNFFVVVPYTPIDTNIKNNLSDLIGRRSSKSLEAGKFEEHKNQLLQRVNVVEQGLRRLGVKTVQLSNDELVELYYHIFNPSDITGSAPIAH